MQKQKLHYALCANLKDSITHRVYKLQFIGHLGERVLTWGRRVPASVFACQGSMPWQANALLFKALPCWGLEPQHGNTDAGTRRPQVRIRPPIRPINCSLPNSSISVVLPTCLAPRSTSGLPLGRWLHFSKSSINCLYIIAFVFCQSTVFS